MELCHDVLIHLIDYPSLEHWSLENGVRCVAATMPDSSLTCLDIWFRAGSLNEKQGEEGMAHFLEHMLFKGSEHLQPGEFDRAIEALGGSSNAATGFDDVHFHVQVPNNEASKALDFLLQLVLKPAIEQAAFDMERDVVLEEIAQYADQPDERVLQELLKFSCSPHPYGRPILGWRKSLLSMDPDLMSNFHRNNYNGNNCCLAIVGPEASKFKSIVNGSMLSGLHSGPNNICEYDQLALKSGRHEIFVDRLESARVIMLWQAAAAMEQQQVVGADLSTSLLGEGRRSMLVDCLREKLQLADTVDMDISVLEMGSLITLEITCREENTLRVEEEVDAVLNRIVHFDIAPEELRRGQHLVANAFRYAVESPLNVSALAASQFLWDRRLDLLGSIEHLASWTPERLRNELFPKLQSSLSCTLIAKPA